MATLKLTDVAVKNLKAGEYWDATLPGFGIRSGKSRKTWLIRYRVGGKQPRLTIGHYPKMGLREAREAAGRALQRIDSGTRPEPAAPHPRSADALTLGGLIDRYEKLRQKEGRNTKTLAEAMRSVRKGLTDYLHLPAREFSKADLRAARDAIAEEAPIAANRMCAYLGPVLAWAAQEDLIEVNFVPAIRRAPEEKRQRVLSEKELAAVWKACDHLGDGIAAKSFGRMVRFLMSTAARRDEAASLKHGDILDGRWRLADTKSGRPHTLRLPPLVLSIIGEGSAHDLVFPGEAGKMSGFSKLKARLDKAAVVSGWRLHDLRRSAATHMRELGVPFHTVEAVLGHAIPGVAGVYQLPELEKQKAEALDVWIAHLRRAVENSHVALNR